MLVGESEESDQNIHHHEGHEPDVSRMPGGVIAGRGGGHDVSEVLNDLLLEGRQNVRVMFVWNCFLGRDHIAGSLDELNGQWSEGRRSLVGQLVGVLDKALRN